MRIDRGMMVVLLAGVFSCGGDDDDGVDTETSLSDLSADEAQALCDEIDASLVEDHVDEAQTLLCYIFGITAGPEDCEAVAAACLEEPPDDLADEVAGMSAVTCDLASGEELPDCAADITVGEYQACFDALLDFLDTLAGEISCDTTLADLAELAAMVPEECSALITACPDLPGIAQ